MIGHAESAAEIDDFQRISELEQAFCHGKQNLHGVEVRPGFHEKRTDVLIYAHKTEIIPGNDILHLRQHVGINAELGLLAAGNDLFAVTGADAGIEADHYAGAGTGLSEQLQLSQGVHAHHTAVINGVSELFGADVVADVGDFFRGKAGKGVDVKFTGAHGVHHAAFGTDDAKKRRIGVGLGGIVHAKAGKRREPQKIAAALAQNVLVVNIQRRTETGDQFAGVFLPIKIDTVRIGGSYVCHFLFRTCSEEKLQK